MDSINKKFIESGYIGKRLKKWKRKVKTIPVVYVTNPEDLR